MAIVSSRKAIHLKDLDRLNQRKTHILNKVCEVYLFPNWSITVGEVGEVVFKFAFAWIFLYCALWLVSKKHLNKWKSDGVWSRRNQGFEPMTRSVCCRYRKTKVDYKTILVWVGKKAYFPGWKWPKSGLVGVVVWRENIGSDVLMSFWSTLMQDWDHFC